MYENNFFSENKKDKEDKINKLFEEQNIYDELNIEQYYLSLKRKLLFSEELKKDFQTLQLILNIFLFKSYSLIKNFQETRILKKEIFILLKNHDAFRYFLYNNGIDDNTLFKIIPHLKYKHFIKDRIICKEGDDSLCMYFILSGRISIMKGTNKLIQIKEINEKENFGQWDIIYHRKRKFSYYASEDCHILIIDKYILRKYLQEKLIKGEDELKTFTTKFLQNNEINALFRIERVIQNMKLLYYRKGEIIYKEGEENTNIYLIYKGETKLVKKIENGEFNYVENLNDNILKIQEKAKNLNYKKLITNEVIEKNIESEKAKINNNTKKSLMENSEYKTLAILGKGNVGGLEISTGIKNKKYTMIANCDYTTIIKIELIYIKDNINRFLLNLLPLFIKLEKEIHSRFKRIIKMDNRIQSNNSLKNNDIDNFDLLDNNKEYINEIKKINKKFDVNEGGFIKMNNLNINLNVSKNKLKEQLMKSNKKFLEINKLVNNYNIGKEYIKYKEVKMFRKNNIKNYLDNNNIPYITSKTYNHKKIYAKKNMSQKYFAEKTLKNFNIVIENYRKRNEFFNINLLNPQLIKTEKSEEKKGNINNEDNKLLKEIIVLDKKKLNKIEEYKNKRNYETSKKKNKYKKRVNSALLINKYNTFDYERKNKMIIINKYILRKLFAKNMIKKKKIKSLEFNFYSNSDKRILYYNTGKYDMPFVSNLISD